MRSVPACLSLFRIGNDGKLTFVRKYDVDVGNNTMFWMGMVPLRAWRFEEAPVTRAHESSGRRTYWSRPHLDAALLEAVAAAGLDLGTATPDALAPLDQFHSGGKEATRTLVPLQG